MILLVTTKAPYMVCNSDFNKLVRTKDKIFNHNLYGSNEGLRPRHEYIYFKDVLEWYNLGSAEYFYQKNAYVILDLIREKKLEIVSKGN